VTIRTPLIFVHEGHEHPSASHRGGAGGQSQAENTVFSPSAGRRVIEPDGRWSRPMETRKHDVGHILKRDRVEVEGHFSLGQEAPHPGVDAVEGVEQARIIEQQEGYSVVELVCSCGRKMQIRCEHPV
jgi:hypothetical protein